MRFLIPPTPWKHQAEAGWVLAMPPTQTPAPFLVCVLTQLPPCPSSRSPLCYWNVNWWTLISCVGHVGTFICPHFLLGHHLPLGLQSDRGTGEAIVCTWDPVLIRKLTFCPITARCKGQVSLAIAVWQMMTMTMMTTVMIIAVKTSTDVAPIACQGLCSVLYMPYLIQFFTVTPWGQVILASFCVGGNRALEKWFDQALTARIWQSWDLGIKGQALSHWAILPNTHTWFCTSPCLSGYEEYNFMIDRVKNATFSSNFHVTRIEIQRCPWEYWDVGGRELSFTADCGSGALLIW